jgi:hypothetical protein
MFDARNAEMAQHKDILRPRQTIAQLVRCERIALERALGIEPHGIHSASFTCQTMALLAPQYPHLDLVF